LFVWIDEESFWERGLQKLFSLEYISSVAALFSETAFALPNTKL